MMNVIHQAAVKRAQSLLEKMTLCEKVGQLNQKLYGFACYDWVDGQAVPNQIFKQEVARWGGLGVLYGLLRADPWAQRGYHNGITSQLAPSVYNRFQRYVMQHSRLGIPMLMASECPHGHQALDGYLLPVNLALGATFNPKLAAEGFSVCSRQLRASGVHLALVSLLDVVRDPRWGRSEECFGEDPHLCAQMAQSIVSAMQVQADEAQAGLGVVAKHLCAQGQGTGGINASPASIGERELRQIHLPAVQACIRAGAKGVMAAYNEIDGVPCHANEALLTGYLRQEQGFSGIVMADGVAVDRLDALTGSASKSGALALQSGVDVSLWDEAFTQLEQAVQTGEANIEAVDRAALRVLTLKYELGLFDHPFRDEKQTAVFDYASHPQSLELARQSIVLLKNQEQLLPLNPAKSLRIALIGPNGDALYNQLGDYSPPLKNSSGITLRQGLEEAFPLATVTQVSGCSVRGLAPIDQQAVLDAVQGSDVVVMALGGSSARNFDQLFDSNGAAISGALPGDMDCGEGADVADLALGGRQNELLSLVAAQGKPVITVLIQGRAHAAAQADALSQALIGAFYGGPMAGCAIAQVLCGAVSPSGCLPVSIPRHSGQLPVYYNKKDLGAALHYVDMASTPLYPFGHGLSYSNFACTQVSVGQDRLSLKQLEDGERFALNCTVTNTCKVDGHAVLQLYIRTSGGGITHRVKELRGFEKVFLKAGESKAIKLHLDAQALSIWDSRMAHTVCPGNVQLFLHQMGELVWQGQVVIG